MRSLLSAEITTDFPHSVRFERISRYSITVKIMQPTICAPCSGSPPATPIMKPWVPSYTVTPDSKVRQKSLRERCIALVQHDADRRQICAAQCLLPKSSPKKRKASERKISSVALRGNFALDALKHHHLEMESKRQRLNEWDDFGIHVVPQLGFDAKLLPLYFVDVTKAPDHLATDWIRAEQKFDLEAQYSDVITISEAHSSTPNWFNKCRNDKLLSTGNTIKPFVAKLKADTKRTVFNWKRCDSLQALTPPDTDGSDSSDTIERLCAVATGSNRSEAMEDLSQAQIQENYREFQELAKRKSEAKGSQRDEEFERAFLADSEAEDWMSKTDGLSDEMSEVDLSE